MFCNKEEISKENQKNTTKPSVKHVKIGQTTYNVSIHFSETTNETVEDKLKRLIETDPQVFQPQIP